jgi:integrase
MRVEHIVDGWWQMPGAPTLDWPGTKNARDHRVFLPQAVRDIIASLIGDKASGFVFSTGRRPITNLDATMRDLCSTLGIESKVTPHDLRGSHGSTVTRLGFGRPAMDRVQNHRTSTVTDTYDRYAYAVEDKTIMEAVASHFLTLALGGGDSGKVVRANFR